MRVSPIYSNQREYMVASWGFGLRKNDMTDVSLSSMLQASWQRSLMYGLDMHRSSSGDQNASQTQLAMLLHSRQQLVAYSCPEMRRLGRLMPGFDGILMLAAPSGIVLCSLGDDSFAARAARVALRPGANWHERWRGTNAIGTVIATGNAVAVEGVEHYMPSNGFLSCAAAPIHDATGQLAGVLNVSNRCGKLSADALNLVRASASRIEYSLFVAHFSREILLSLHPFVEFLETPLEGLLALSEDGIVVGANESAKILTGLTCQEIGKVRSADFLKASPSPSKLLLSQAIMPLQLTRRPDGIALYGRIHRKDHAGSQTLTKQRDIRHTSAMAHVQGIIYR